MCEADHSLSSNAEVKTNGAVLYLRYPVSLNGIVLNYIIEYKDNFSFTMMDKLQNSSFKQCAMSSSKNL
jgi:hypothetical protein